MGFWAKKWGFIRETPQKHDFSHYLGLYLRVGLYWSGYGRPSPYVGSILSWSCQISFKILLRSLFYCNTYNILWSSTCLCISLETTTICYGFIINDCSPVASFGRTITFVAWTMRQIPKNGYFSLIIRKREDCLHLPQSVTMWKPILHSAQMGVIIILHLYCYCIGLHRRPLCENRMEVTSIV